MGYGLKVLNQPKAVTAKRFRPIETDDFFFKKGQADSYSKI